MPGRDGTTFQASIKVQITPLSLSTKLGRTRFLWHSASMVVRVHYNVKYMQGTDILYGSETDILLYGSGFPPSKISCLIQPEAASLVPSRITSL